MKNIITEEMKSSRYALEIKSTYTYRVFENGNGEISISVQKTSDFKKASLCNEAICTMTKKTFDRLSIEDINWIVRDFLRVNVRYGAEVLTAEVDENGRFTAEVELGFGTEKSERQFTLKNEDGPAVLHEIVRFEVGKKYTVCALYGGFYTIEIIGRTESTITYVEPGYESEPDTASVVMYTGNVYGKDLNIIGTVTCEQSLAWEYHSPYAKDKSDTDKCYFSAFDFDQLYTQDEI